MNETLKAIKERYSCRNYSDKQVDKSLLQSIAEAAVQSPSAMNGQPWEVVVVTDQELIREMDEEGLRILAGWEDKSMYEVIKERNGAICCGAPCVMMIPIKKGASMDCGIVCQSITIAAASLGIQSLVCWQAGIALSDEKGAEFMKRMDFPQDYEFGIAVLIGYEKSKGTPHNPDLSKIKFV